MLKDLAGVRAVAKVSLEIDKNTFRQELGEIIFSADGISGIPVMNMSRHAVRALDSNRKCCICLDFFSDLSKDKLKMMLSGMISGRNVKIEQALVGILNHKLLDAFLVKTGNKGKDTGSNDINTDGLIGLLKNFRLEITGSAGWENAQVTTGGLPLDEVSLSSMQAKFCKGLYITGETLDVDGCCGGYNLQWAWSTGAIAGASATSGKLDKTKILY